MNDVRISINYLDSAEIRRLGQELRSDPSDTQPGWYVRATKDEGYKDIVKYTRITGEHALSIAAAIDTALGRTGHLGLPNEAVQRAVAAGNREHAENRKRRRAAAERQLAEAEATLNALDAEEGI